VPFTLPDPPEIASVIGILSVFTPIGGEFIGIDTVSVLVAGTHSVAAWMIPVIVSSIGITIGIYLTKNR